MAQSPAPAETQQTAPPVQQTASPVQQGASTAPPNAPAADQAPAAQPSAPADAQQAAPADAGQAAGPTKAPDATPAKPGDHAEKPTAEELHDAAVTEDQLRQQLIGKTFYLRGGYQDNILHFTEKGDLDGSSPKASYTLSLVEIERVKVDKHHVELEGVRYGLHFLGALATEDQAANVDRVKLTSKKKPLKITIDRELVVAPKKEKPAKDDKKSSNEKKPPSWMAAIMHPKASVEPPAAAVDTSANATTATPALKEAETNRRGVTITTSQAEANKVLHDALDHIFSAGIDERMVATLPDYWKLYYKAVEEKADYKPADSVLRASQVDKKPHLLRGFEPPSNEYAQNNGVAGMAMYHVIVGADGTPQEVAIGRPIGFGLDENAVDSIRKSSFEPGMKDGKAVPVEVDLTVQFRIYSNRTAASASEAAQADPNAPKKSVLPGPYSVNHQ
jgi:TonB family protein